MHWTFPLETSRHQSVFLPQIRNLILLKGLRKFIFPFFFFCKWTFTLTTKQTESLRLFGTRSLNHAVTWSNTHQLTTLVNCFKNSRPGVKPRRRNRDDKWPRAAQNYIPTGRRVGLRRCCREDYEIVQALSRLIPQGKKERLRSVICTLSSKMSPHIMCQISLIVIKVPDD
jgi:hypothetical protein